MNCLLLVDIQNDFLPGGALAVPDGDKVIPVANKLQPAFPLVVATQDWHPANHGSFAASHPGGKVFEQIELNGLPQTLWPVHCVQEGHGAQFVKGLDTSKFAKIIEKGVDPEIDSYSGFFDNGNERDTGLAKFLKEKKVDEVHVVGLATDYTVKFTALDAKQLGYTTIVHKAGCRAVNLNPGDEAKALAGLVFAGVQVK